MAVKDAMKILGDAALAASESMGGVPNQPKTPVSNFRLPTDLKTRAATKAAEEGRTLTSVIVEKLEEYVEEKQ